MELLKMTGKKNFKFTLWPGALHYVYPYDTAHLHIRQQCHNQRIVHCVSALLRIIAQYSLHRRIWAERKRTAQHLSHESHFYCSRYVISEGNYLAGQHILRRLHCQSCTP